MDSGLDEEASEAFLNVLSGRAKTIAELDLSRNRIGMRGANALARFICQKGTVLPLYKCPPENAVEDCCVEKSDFDD